MNRALKISALAISILLHPILMPTFGMVMFCLACPTIANILMTRHLILSLTGTLFFTLLIPTVMLLLLRKRGQIESLYITDAKQRTTPYIYTIICYCIWAYFLRMMLRMPLFIFLVAVGAIIALVSILIINNWWKISAHLTGLGGLIGGICSFALNYAIVPTYIIIIAFILALLLMYTRLYLNAHTPLQVVGGLVLGIFSTFIPTLIMTHA